MTVLRLARSPLLVAALWVAVPAAAQPPGAVAEPAAEPAAEEPAAEAQPTAEEAAVEETAADAKPAEEPAAEEAPRGTVVFIHGLFMTGDSWSGWVDWFEARGWRGVAVSAPGRDGEPAALRADPPDRLRDLDFDDVLDHWRGVIAEQEGPVVLIGHSMGGLVVQRLLQEDLAVAGVAIDSAPPKGLNSLAPSFLRSNGWVLSPGSRPKVPSVRWFRYAFAHTLPKDEVEAIYDAYVVPESRHVAKGPVRPSGRVDWKADRPPLLLVAGEADRITPAGLNRRNADRYRKSPAVTDFVAFPDRVHWIVGQDGWEEVAEEVHGWIQDRLAH